MKASTQRFYSLILSFAFVLGAIFVYISFLRPEMTKISELRSKKSVIESTLADYQKSVDETNKILARYKSLAELESSFSLAIPSDESIPSLVNQISGLGVLNKVIISGIEFQYLPQDPQKVVGLVRPFSTLRTTVKFSGTYADMKNFVSSLESNIRLMDVNSLSISDGGKKSNPILNYTLIVDAYYQSQ